MMKATQNHFNWLHRDDVCLGPVNHVLCLIKTVSSLYAGAPGYCLSEKEFENNLKLRIFQFEYFILIGFFYYDNLAAVLKFQVSI